MPQNYRLDSEGLKLGSLARTLNGFFVKTPQGGTRRRKSRLDSEGDQNTHDVKDKMNWIFFQY